MPLVPGTNTSKLAVLRGLGLTSRQDVEVEIASAPVGSGITFYVFNSKAGSYAQIPCAVTNVVNTLRNVVLGKDGVRLCIVEHFLAVATLWGLDDIDVKVIGPEMPIGDGSGQIWTDLFIAQDILKKTITPSITLVEPIIIAKHDRILMALPDSAFSVSYMMDWDHPLIGKRWQSWDLSKDIDEISSARTFGWLKDHQMLGFADDVVSLTAEGFSQPLRFEDEPVRHKLLDLVGDLALCGINPLKFKARFISIKGGHELDVEMARRLSELLN